MDSRHAQWSPGSELEHRAGIFLGWCRVQLHLRAGTWTCNAHPGWIGPGCQETSMVFRCGTAPPGVVGLINPLEMSKIEFIDNMFHWCFQVRSKYKRHTHTHSAHVKFAQATFHWNSQSLRMMISVSLLMAFITSMSGTGHTIAIRVADPSCLVSDWKPNR